MPATCVLDCVARLEFEMTIACRMLIHTLIAVVVFVDWSVVEF